MHINISEIIDYSQIVFRYKYRRVALIYRQLLIVLDNKQRVTDGVFNIYYGGPTSQ